MNQVVDRSVVRSFITELLTPTCRDALVVILGKVEQHTYDLPAGPPAPPQERVTIPRFKEIFAAGELLPPNVFVLGLEMKEGEIVNGQNLQFDGNILLLRDRMVMAYKPVATAARILDKEIPARLLLDFCMLWFTWEAAWLRNREVHAVQALQPLCNAILSLEPLVMSKKKEKLLPHPHAIHQKVISYRCLEGFLSSFSVLCAVLLSSLQCVMDHDTRLLVLADYFVRKNQPENEDLGKFVHGAATTPGVLFPHGAGEQMDVEQYILCLGRNSVNLFHEKSQLVLEAFDDVVEVLFNIQTTLHEMSPHLDQHASLVKKCAYFERIYRQAKKLLLEPSNLV
eukprot:GEMP01050369.1.p1 GENE.GEMP01050369.1~~GEMP01050369.1.p1  ORF type:complete len:340 (+),score=63.70 GEMP01050369.1:19-1038(+)